MVVIIVLLKFMAYDFNRSIREKAMLESSPDVGSCKYKCKIIWASARDFGTYWPVANAQASLRICEDLPEPLLLA